jgi:hypothetical protein
MRKGEEKEKPNNSTQLGRGTIAGEAQAHQRTDQAKAVTRWAHLGVGAPRVRPHPHRLLLAPLFSRSCMAVCGGGSQLFPFLPGPNRHTLTVKERLGLSSKHTSFGATHLTSLLVLFSFSISL